MDRVEMSLKVAKTIEKLPLHIRKKFKSWLMDIENNGYLKSCKTRGYDDEPLIGKRSGQRSVRLNRSYRVIYTVRLDIIHIIKIIEVNKHDY